MKTVAILGCGFIGRHLLTLYVGLGFVVRVLDRNSCPSAYAGQVEWVQGTLDDLDKVKKVVSGADVVFHLISSTVPRDQVDESQEILNNVVQTIDLLKVCSCCNVGRIIFISSASVYGVTKSLPVDEEMLTNPISSHGVHKLMVEKYIQLYKYRHGLDCKILRLANPYGYGQDLNGRQGFVAMSIGKVAKGEAITILGDGGAVRDYVYIDDVVRACELASISSAGPIVLNIGSGCGMSLMEVIQEIQFFSKNKIQISFQDAQKSDIPASILSIKKAQNFIGYNPATPFREGLQKMLEMYAIKDPSLMNKFNWI